MASNVSSNRPPHSVIFDNVTVCPVTDDGLHVPSLSPGGDGTAAAQLTGVRVEIIGAKHEFSIKISKGTQAVEQISLSSEIETAKVGAKALIVSSNDSSYMFCFSSLKDLKSFETVLKTVASKTEASVFTQRTDASSAEQYFQFYGYMSQQQNMMQDYIRTSTYQRAMLDNLADFQNKVVLDVGAGSGILSFFAIQAGARKVYAIEASSMAQHCQTLVENNRLRDDIVVIAGKIEEIDVPEPIDVIISEPMGYMLFNERMLETFLHAKKWLKPNGKMYPTQGDLHIAPFTDETLYMEQCSKANFWYQPAFHSVDLTSLREAAVQEYFRQPIVDTFDIRICLARSQKYSVNFQTAHESDLYNIDIPVSFVIMQAGTIHGLAFWFDVAFFGSQTTVWLSTAPTQPLTHWYQVRCLLQTPIFVKQGQRVVGKVILKSNKRQSYDVEISLGIPGTTIKSSNILDLKNPFFRYTGQQPQPPPGTNTASPSDSYWNQQDLTGQAAAAGGVQANAYNVALLNGAMGDGSQLLQTGVVYNNLVPLGNLAQINQGGISSPGLVQVNSSLPAMQTRTSVGGGISPILMAQGGLASSSSVHQQQQLVGNQYIIGDYLLQANNIMPMSVNSLGLIN